MLVINEFFFLDSSVLNYPKTCIRPGGYWNGGILSWRDIVRGDIVLEPKVGGKEVVTYLGGRLDQTLSGKSMAQKIIHKANASLKFLYRKKMFLNQYCRKTVCMAMIQSRMDYASNFYYHGLPKFLESPSGRTKQND